MFVLLQEIARNKRRSVIVVALFVLVWVGIGALLGVVVRRRRARRVGRSSPASPSPRSSPACAVLYAITAGSRLVLAVSGAQPADPHAVPRSSTTSSRRWRIAAGLPKPAVYVIDDPSPNAFATGISPNKAAITATTGLLAIMNREELEGVISHEMSHIKNYDVRLILIVTTLIGIAGLLASLVWRSAFFMRPRGRDGEQIMILVSPPGRCSRSSRSSSAR